MAAARWGAAALALLAFSIAAATMPLVAQSGALQLGRAPDPRFALDANDVPSFADCAERATRLMDQLWGLDERAYRRKLQTFSTGLAGHCLVEGLARSHRGIIAGQLAELVLIKEQGEATMGAALARDKAQPAVGLNTSEAMGICVIRAQLMQSWALFASEPGSSDERLKMQGLVPAVGGCVQQGERLVLNITELRAALALGAYRLAYGYDGLDPEVIVRNPVAEQSAMKYGRCIAQAQPTLAYRVLIYPRGSEQEQKSVAALIDKAPAFCSDKVPGGTRITIPRSLMRGAMAEELYLLQFGGKNIDSLKAIPERGISNAPAQADPGEAEKLRIDRSLKRVGFCIVGRSPSAVYRLILTAPASDEEAGALKDIGAALEACRTAGEHEPDNVPLLRAAVSEMLYFASLQANAAGAAK